MKTILLILVLTGLMFGQSSSLLFGDDDEVLLTLILAGDIQVEDEAEFNDVRESVSLVNRYNPDFVLFAGDIGYPRGDGTAPEGSVYYDSLYAILTGLNAPYYFTSGNHDNDILVTDADSNWNAFNHFIDLTNADTASNGWLSVDTLFAADGYDLRGAWTLVYRGVKLIETVGTDSFYVVFYSHDNNSSAGSATGGVNDKVSFDADIVWLQNILDSLYSANNKIIICSHYPTYPYSWYAPNSVVYDFTNFTAVRNLIRDYSNILFVHNGHVHQSHVDADYRFPFIISSRFTEGTAPRGGESPGFYLAKIYKDKVVFTAIGVDQDSIGITATDKNYTYNISARQFTNPDGYEAESIAYFGRAGSSLSTTRKDTIDLFVKMLKDSLWTSELNTIFDALWLLANTDSLSSVSNVIADTNNCVFVASPTFAVDRGITTNGSTSYLNTNLYPLYANNFTQNSGSFGIVIATNVAEVKADFGMSTNGGGVIELQSRRDALGKTVGTVNTTGGSVTTSSINSSKAIYIVTRTNASTVAAYKNGALDYNDNMAVAAIPPYTFYIGGKNKDNVLVIPSSKQYRVAFVSKGLTDLQARKITNCLEWYLDAIGAGVQ